MASSVNYRRGLRRAYLAASLLWIAPVITASFVQYDNMKETVVRAPDVEVRIDSLPGMNYWLGQITVAILPPPAGYILLFVIVPWIVKGFREPEAPNKNS